MRKNILTTIVLAGIVLFNVNCGGHKENETAGMQAVSVKVSPVSTEGENSYVTASGTVEAANNANLSTRMMGFVNKVYVKVGDKVRKGQLLIAINNADLKAKLAQVNAGITEATAAFTNAEKDYNRFKNLLAENSVSQKEMDDMTAHFDMAKARLEAAKEMKNEVDAQFTYVNIRAPFDGVVTNKFIEEGDMANPGMPLLAVEAPKNFEVTAMVAESDISYIKSGANAEVTIKSLGKTLNGNVTEISTSAMNTGGQYLVKINLDKTDANILSGMFVNVSFPVAKKASENQMILIPVTSVVESGGLKGIYTVSDEGKAVLRWLRLGKTYGDQVEVLSGLNASEKYIVSADGKLFNRAKVTIQ